ncbi:MAG: hypothetical protein ACNA7W_21415 [Pseudomonadales bacterium]
MSWPRRIICSSFCRWLPAAAALLAGAAWGAGDWPRLADGRPDLNGVWQALNTANYDIRPHDARAALMLVDGPAGPVPAPQLAPLGAVGAVPAGPGVVAGGEIPYQGWAFERQQENQRDWINRDPEIRCFLPGVPRAHYMPYPFQIVQGSGSLYFAYEYAGAVRNVHLVDPGPPPRPSWMGQSVAHWEDDTLVIVVSGFNGRTWLDRAGNFHSDALIVTERFTPTSAYTLEYQATLEDVKVYTRPWTMRMTLYRRVGDDARIHPLKCAAFVEELIYGHLRQEP